MVVKIKKKSDEDLLYCFFISAQNSPRLPKYSYKYSLFLFC